MEVVLWLLHIQSQYNHRSPYYRRQKRKSKVQGRRTREILQNGETRASLSIRIWAPLLYSETQGHRHRRWQECPLGGESVSQLTSGKGIETLVFQLQGTYFCPEAGLFPRTCNKGYSPTNTQIFQPRETYLGLLTLQNCGTINECCFKLLSLW